MDSDSSSSLNESVATAVSPARLTSGRARPLGVAWRLVTAESWTAIASAWLASRLLVFASAAAVQVFGFPGGHRRGGFLHHPFAWLTTWDGHWYKAIAQHGYLLVPGRYSDPAFFPFFSILLRGLHTTGLPYDLAGLALANVMLPVALIGLYKLACLWLPEPDARRVAILAALFPAGAVLSMIYPESLALSFIAFAGVFAARRHWLLCAVCAAGATLARPEGVLLVVPVAACAVRAWSGLSPVARGRAIAAVLVAPATLATVSIYFWQTLGDPFAWSKAEQAWGRSFEPLGVYHALAALATADHYQLWLIRDAVFFTVYIILLGLAWKAKLPRSWILAGVAAVALPVMSGSFTSDERFGLMAPPVYAGIAILARQRLARRFIIAGMSLLLVASTLTLPLRFP
jgi:hypothetical protein